jgi:hypothetical protein
MKNLADNQAYKTMVKDYSSRKMSCNSDVLAAIHGVLQSITPFKHDFFFCGLLESGLDWALLWHPQGPLRRREGLPPRNRLFPTWSWAGWVGPAGYDHMGSSKDNFPTISDWTFRSETGEETEVITESIPSLFPTLDQQSELDEKRKRVLYERSEIFSSSRSSLHSGVLCFTTRSAHFRVDSKHDPQNGYLIYRGGSHNSSFKDGIAMFRIKNNEDWVGSVVLEFGFAKTLAEELVDAEFIILSESLGYEGGIAYSEEKREWYPVRNFDADRFGFRKGDGRSVIPLMYNVMWVRREDGMAYRVAIGQIHIDAWNHADLNKADVKICLG